MGNHPSKERPTEGTEGTTTLGNNRPEHNRSTNSQNNTHTQTTTSNRRRASSRHDLSLFSGLSRSGEGSMNLDPSSPEARKETKAERDARKLEKERAEREVERARSMQEEGVDGGYLVTLGTYTGKEDFNKRIVRQLMIQRRLAPFWQGLNDHSSSWTDNQLVAAAKKVPIPPPGPDPTPPPPKPAQQKKSDRQTGSKGPYVNTLKLPATPTPSSYPEPSHLSVSHPAFLSSPSSPQSSSPSLASPLFRGRAKTLATLTSPSRNNLQSDLTPQEVPLPKDDFYNGRHISAILYKDADDCPICFLAYPPYLNTTTCCHQPICSECFVQIKRPDPHPPEHADPDSPPPEPTGNNIADEFMLVSEPATCPYCKKPEFGVTYQPPPFRRGLSYGPLEQVPELDKPVPSGISSATPMGSQRDQQTLFNDKLDATTVTTDFIRPDWAKKLADARGNALRRAAAATALHNAAFVLNNIDNTGRFQIGRRRRTFFGSEGENTNPPLNLGNVGALLAAANQQQDSVSQGVRNMNGQNDLFPGRGSSRRSRIEDLEELMMMEAIRMSIAEEEERKRKEAKEADKKAKKDEKKAKKEAKKLGKTSRKNSLYPLSFNDSNASQLTGGESSATGFGKGKGVDRTGSIPTPDTASPVDSPVLTFDGYRTRSESVSKEEEQEGATRGRQVGQIGQGKFAGVLDGAQAGGGQTTGQADGGSSQEGASGGPTTGLASTSASGALAGSAPLPIGGISNHRSALRQLSNASSLASSFSDNPALDPNSSFEASPNASGLNLDGTAFSETPPSAGAGIESMFNFRSLAAVIGDDGSPSNEKPQSIPSIPSPDETFPSNDMPSPSLAESPSPPAAEGNPSSQHTNGSPKHTAKATVVDEIHS